MAFASASQASQRRYLALALRTTDLCISPGSERRWPSRLNVKRAFPAVDHCRGLAVVWVEKRVPVAVLDQSREQATPCNSYHVVSQASVATC